MSGSGRRTAYRKTTQQQALHGLPEPTGRQLIARVLGSQGSNLIEIEGPSGPASRGLATLPTKFRKLIWVKRGDYVIVDEAVATSDSSSASVGGSVGPAVSGVSYQSSSSASVGGVRYQIEHILFAEQVDQLRKAGKWPAGFAEAEKAAPRTRRRDMPREAEEAGEEPPKEDSQAAAEVAGDMPLSTSAAVFVPAPRRSAPLQMSRGRPGDLPPSDSDEEQEEG